MLDDRHRGLGFGEAGLFREGRKDEAVGLVQHERVGRRRDIARVAQDGLNRAGDLAEGEAEDFGPVHDEIGLVGAVAFGVRAFSQ